MLNTVQHVHLSIQLSLNSHRDRVTDDERGEGGVHMVNDKQQH